MNTVVGMATAFADSTAVMLMTGSAHTYMCGHGLFQEIERWHVADNPRIFEPVVKEWWQPSRVDELPFVLHPRPEPEALRSTRPSRARPADGRPSRGGGDGVSVSAARRSRERRESSLYRGRRWTVFGARRTAGCDILGITGTTSCNSLSGLTRSPRRSEHEPAFE
jgi:hypothetical protein